MYGLFYLCLYIFNASFLMFLILLRPHDVCVLFLKYIYTYRRILLAMFCSNGGNAGRFEGAGVEFSSCGWLQNLGFEG